MKFISLRTVEIALAIFLFFTSVNTTRASENEIFADNFNDYDISDWQVARNIQWSNPSYPCMRGSSIANWSAITGALGIIINSPGCVTEIKPMNLDLSTHSNYTINYDWFLESGVHMDRNFALLWKDPQNWIGIKILDNTLIIQKVYENNYQIIPGSQTIFPFEPNRTYHMELRYEKTGRIVVSIDNQVITDVTDKMYPVPYSGSYSFAAQASVGAIRSSTTSFDNIVVTSLQDDTLGVNLIKQSQAPWGQLEYDSASEWATASQGSTYSDWGCALTSAVMIMNYHGITKMPDGTPVTPLTLNNWLLENHGYVDKGYVSFAAIAGLTKKLSVQYGHPALQYSRNDLQPRETARAEISADRPVIVVKPGHFMVADGIVTGIDDLYIKDPSFPYTKFSQHNATQISTRLLTPSFTDVSFLTIAADPATQVKIFDETGHELDATPTIEQLESPINPGQFSPAVQIIEVPQPASGVYRIEVISDSTAEMIDTTVTTVDRSGDSIRHTIPSDEQLAQLKFDKDVPSQIEYLEPEGYFKLGLLIEKLWKTQEISSEDLYEQLKEIVAVGEAGSENQSMFETVKLLRRVISSHKVGRDLTTHGKAVLMKGLQEVQVESVKQSKR